MPDKIARFLSARRAAHSGFTDVRAPHARVWMDALEQRTHLSASPSIFANINLARTSAALSASLAPAPPTPSKGASNEDPDTTTPDPVTVTGNVTYIGPSRDAKSFSDVEWPNEGDKPVTFLVDDSSKAYELQFRYIYGNVTILPSDANARPTLKLPAVFKGSGSKYTAGNGTLSVKGSLKLKGFDTVGGIDTVLIGSQPGSNVHVEDIHMDGGAVWLGSGANNAIFINNEIRGKPRANVYASYGGTVKNCVIDHSGTNVPVLQGGRMVSGKPIGEAAIRIMNVDNLTLKGIRTEPWFYKSGTAWKQDVQIRPKSKLIKVIDCDFYLVDVGDMAWRNPAYPIDKVQFIDTTIRKWLSFQAGVKVVELINTTIGSTDYSKTLKSPTAFK